MDESTGVHLGFEPREGRLRGNFRPHFCQKNHPHGKEMRVQWGQYSSDVVPNAALYVRWIIALESRKKECVRLQVLADLHIHIFCMSFPCPVIKTP